MLKSAFGEQTLARTQGFEWFSQLKSDATFVDDPENSEGPLTSKRH